jgi:hypothetical protein
MTSLVNIHWNLPEHSIYKKSGNGQIVNLPSVPTFLSKIVLVLFFGIKIAGNIIYKCTVKPLAPHRCGFESQQGLWIFSCKEAIQLVYGTSGSTQVPVCAWNNARKGTWGLPPPVKLERRDMIYTVSMWHKTPNKQLCSVRTFSEDLYNDNSKVPTVPRGLGVKVYNWKKNTCRAWMERKCQSNIVGRFWDNNMSNDYKKKTCINCKCCQWFFRIIKSFFWRRER